MERKGKKKAAINRLFLMLWATHFISLNNFTNMFHNRAYFVCSSSDSDFINLVLIIFVVRSYLSSYRMRNGSRLTPNILFGGGQTQDLIIPNENVAPRNKNAFERHVAAMKWVVTNFISYLHVFLMDFLCFFIVFNCTFFM